ncbi:MAG: SAM-dependent chlorinase/fluorinase [Planctomycetia bacterium]|nr:SAM-dependent chlorinase/fluorinase [Planctomycetia bacterium]
MCNKNFTSRIITLTTDFGEGSSYVAAMKGVLLSTFPEAKIIDITHSIFPQNIEQAASVLHDVSQLFPPGTIHVVVIDPGVGTERDILYAELGEQCYIFPNNGVLGSLSHEIAPKCVIKLENSQFWRHPVSHTFHGRDIMAPVAAQLAQGLDPHLLGKEASEIMKLSLDQPEILENRITGKIRLVDSFGNLITNIRHEHLSGRTTDSSVCIIIDIYETYGIYRTYGDLPEGALIAVVGSNGYLEMAVVGSNAAEQLGVEVGQKISLIWDGE